MRIELPLAGLLSLGLALTAYTHAAHAADARDWVGDLTPLGVSDWNAARAEHLLERAGFGGTPDDVAELARLEPGAAVRRLVYFEGAAEPDMLPFSHSGIFDPGLDPFPRRRSSDASSDVTFLSHLLSHGCPGAWTLPL
ncbi:MAG: hypothetical protein O7H39_03110, partial [Gammaproteobacteria bacterium]|nr:hypothetical protein [Gammaproteobacteria bacterium]